MFRINRFFIAIIQLVLLIDSTQQSYVKQAITTVKTFGSTMKKSMTILRQNKNTIKNIAYGVQKKYLQTKHSFASKSVKHLGVEAIKKFKHTAPQAARGGKQLFSLESKKNIQMRSGSQINGKDLGFVIKRSAEYMRGKELSSLINMVSKSKFQLPALAGGGIMRLKKDIPESSFSDTLSSMLDDPLVVPPVNLKPEGNKKYTLDCGAIWEGAIQNDKMHGPGKLTYSDGDVNEGNFIEGHMQGKGKTLFKDGHVYEGNFIDSIILGKGKVTYAYGDVYEGEVIQRNEDEDIAINLPNGYGKQTTVKEEEYRGKFVDGKLQGEGTFTDKKTERYYDGMFRDGLMEGSGKMHYKSLDVFNGNFKNNKKTGYGELFYYDGDWYKGEWLNNMSHGKGEFYSKYDDKLRKGIWNLGVFVKEL